MCVNATTGRLLDHLTRGPEGNRFIIVFENSVWRIVSGTDFLLSAVQAWHRYSQRAAYRPQLPHQETAQTWRMVV